MFQKTNPYGIYGNSQVSLDISLPMSFIKGEVISEGIFNLVPNLVPSSKNKPNHFPLAQLYNN